MVEKIDRSMELQGCWHESGLIKQFNTTSFFGKVPAVNATGTTMLDG